ncbi:MAG: hypothetical protein IJZ54_01365 [Clostridia bacterium]|nr:hypothetical protein [Clostridia bacterium]
MKNRVALWEDLVFSQGIRFYCEKSVLSYIINDYKVAAKCSGVLFIVDGNIKGEYNVDVTAALRDRERALNNWLMEMGF